ncbi:MAG: helix-turn-helix transcriptional regulator [Methylovulum sp.]|uniref:helix-turn-helix domain-containing protein n=1 Tax=Methylovulum sp. TaxID=1916980 RepID=UPI002634ECAA|nr:helix-turn-helix transcriptional regulator [Methylovulum sp.]MDD2724894.1 helix-turn-helix transcriptional regulator [Methylovulum sp.]MDD5124704.1 helix-turn-helix transcriptional regulator [Methylovulum sp.]
MKINEKIRFVRQLRELSQEDMAEKLGLSLNGYANIERGDTDVQMSRLEQIAQIFGMDLLELFNYGERIVNCAFSIGDNNPVSNAGNHYTGDAKETQFELQKQQLIIEQQLKEIAYLKEIITLTKGKQE